MDLPKKRDNRRVEYHCEFAEEELEHSKFVCRKTEMAIWRMFRGRTLSRSELEKELRGLKSPEGKRPLTEYLYDARLRLTQAGLLKVLYSREPVIELVPGQIVQTRARGKEKSGRVLHVEGFFAVILVEGSRTLFAGHLSTYSGLRMVTAADGLAGDLRTALEITHGKLFGRDGRALQIYGMEAKK